MLAYILRQGGGECSGGICEVEWREVVEEKVNEQKEVESHGGENGNRDKRSQEE